ncbi:MAG: NAD-dependent epimerase/dehydratase family protein [Opitutales bacterium]|nr:NAD-dependent epimerase/dehydratase family protein [Opitutales bacterium]
MKALVTGGGGFLGRRIVERLLARGCEVRSYQRSGHPDLAAKGVEVVQGSLVDRSALQAAMFGVDVVFHVAAKAGVWGRRQDFESANVLGTRNVLKCMDALGIRDLVYTSTPSVVFSGEAFEGADESLPYGRNWLCDYARTKAEAEALVLARHDGDARRCVALRPHLIWGPEDPHLLPRVIEAACSGRLKQVGDGRNWVDITYVENAADAHLQAWDALRSGRCGGQAYFLSQGEPVELWPWINQLLERIGEKPLAKSISARAAYVAGVVAEALWTVLPLKGEPPMTRFVSVELSKSHWFSIEAARRDFAYRPENHPTEAGLDAFVEWWQKVRK